MKYFYSIFSVTSCIASNKAISTLDTTWKETKDFCSIIQVVRQWYLSFFETQAELAN